MFKTRKFTYKCIRSYTINFPTSTTREETGDFQSVSLILSQKPTQYWGGRKGWCDFAEILILSCLQVLQNKRFAVFRSFRVMNFNAVCGFLMLFCAVFIRNSVRFCCINTPLLPPQSWWCHSLHFSHSIQFKTSAVLFTGPGGSGFKQVKSNPLISKSFLRVF